MNKLGSLEKIWFGLLRNADGADGGGAGTADAAAVPSAEASPAASAGAEGDAPAATFLSGAKPEDEAKPAEGEAKPAEAPAAFDVASVKLPEGVTLDEEVGKSFTDIFNNAELSLQERGQQLLDLHVKALSDLQISAAETFKTTAQGEWTKMNDEWRGQIKDLPEFKANPDAEAGKVMQALKAVGADDKFFSAMDLTGAGNHPAVLQVLHRLTKPFLEGSAVGADGKAAAPARMLGANIYTSSQPKE